MSPRWWVALACVAIPLGAGPAHAEPTPTPPGMAIEHDRTEVSVVIGERFEFTSTVRAPAETAASGWVAHLNIVGLDPEVYVDPEDWSEQRTQYLPEIPPGGAVTLPWSVHAVNDGTFIVYVALARADAGGPVQAGPGLRAQVASQQVINPGGILPIASAVPAGLLALTLATRVRRRRRS